jgi:hypothetical protein
MKIVDVAIVGGIKAADDTEKFVQIESDFTQAAVGRKCGHIGGGIDPGE